MCVIESLSWVTGFFFGKPIRMEDVHGSSTNVGWLPRIHEYAGSEVFGSASRLWCFSRELSGCNNLYACRHAKPTNLAALKKFSSSIFR